MNLWHFLKGSAFHLWGLTTLMALAILSLTRLVLFGHTVWLDSQPASSLFASLPLGLLRDIPSALLISLPWAIAGILPSSRWLIRLSPPLLTAYFFVLLLVGVSETAFWHEFATRFNFIAVDYLIFTHEVLGNIWEAYPVLRILAALLVLAISLTWKFHTWVGQAIRTPTPQLAPPTFLLIAGAAALLFWHTPPPEFSTNTYANELADNGWRSFIWAARQNQLDYRQFYALRPDHEALEDLRHLSGQQPISATLPATTQARYTNDLPNVVVVMMESLSAEYMSRFGSRHRITPNLDKLARDGVLMTRLYATGTRTVRGLEALSAALPPLPGKSVVRWPNVNGLNTLGGILGNHGWSPHFIYGGYGTFDNMNSYFASQGYHVTDRRDFAPGLIEFENVWGVADEHLFDQVLLEIDRDHAAGQPFFGHVMTTSNHIPFTYPEGRVDIPSPGGREGAVKYADYAIGRFIEIAKKKPWFDNTIFLFVADHCAFSAGKVKIPVHRYHIPAILYAPHLLPPREVDTLSSQIDLVPTLLGLVGLSQESRFIGRDVLSASPGEGRALLSTYQDVAYLKGNVLTILRPRQKVETYLVKREGRQEHSIASDPQLVNEAIAYFQGTALLLEQHALEPPAHHKQSATTFPTER